MMPHLGVVVHLFVLSVILCRWPLSFAARAPVSLNVHHPLSVSSLSVPNHMVEKRRTSIMDTPPACNPAVGVRREMDGGIRQADRQDSLRKLDGVLEAHQGDVCTGALLPGVHRVGKRPGNAHLLGPGARVLQLPGAQQHRELGWLVQSAGGKREGGGIRQEPLMARKGPGRVFGGRASTRSPHKSNRAFWGGAGSVQRDPD